MPAAGRQSHDPVNARSVLRSPACRGDLAFRDGYQRSHTDVALVTVVLLLVLVQLLQLLQIIGDRLVAHYSRR
ncbi:hypothetical protein [Stenotrophomonas pavanii]|uniref:hypothetical protein n=1 Tax=Stenotrophomonas pavanii TaxID=487698 RepID=UPI003CE4E99B